MSKFKEGDKVQMTAETLKVNSGARSTTGIITKSGPDQYGQIRLRRDGLKTIEIWHESAWDIAPKKSDIKEQP